MYTVDLSYEVSYFHWEPSDLIPCDLIMTDVFTDCIYSLVESNEDYLLVIL